MGRKGLAPSLEVLIGMQPRDWGYATTLQPKQNKTWLNQQTQIRVQVTLMGSWERQTAIVLHMQNLLFDLSVRKVTSTHIISWQLSEALDRLTPMQLCNLLKKFNFKICLKNRCCSNKNRDYWWKDYVLCALTRSQLTGSLGWPEASGF